MGSPLLVAFSDVFMTKREANNVVIPSKPVFHCRRVDDVYNQRKKIRDFLFDGLNSYHLHIQVSIVKSKWFSDTKLARINGVFKFNVYQKTSKLLMLWAFYFYCLYKFINSSY